MTITCLTLASCGSKRLSSAISYIAFANTAKENHEKYSRDEQILINYLLKHDTIQTSEAARLWKLSDRATRTRLSKMLKEGIVIRISTSPKDPHAVFVLRKD